MKIIAARDFSLKNKIYKKGKEVKITSKKELIKLNEMGFINPLTLKEINELFEEKNKMKEGNDNEN